MLYTLCILFFYHIYIYIYIHTYIHTYIYIEVLGIVRCWPCIHPQQPGPNRVKSSGAEEDDFLSSPAGLLEIWEDPEVLAVLRSFLEKLGKTIIYQPFVNGFYHLQKMVIWGMVYYCEDRNGYCHTWNVRRPSNCLQYSPRASVEVIDPQKTIQNYNYLHMFRMCSYRLTPVSYGYFGGLMGKPSKIIARLARLPRGEMIKFLTCWGSSLVMFVGLKPT